MEDSVAALEAETAATRAADLVEKIEDLAVQMVLTRRLAALDAFDSLARQRADAVDADEEPEIVD